MGDDTELSPIPVIVGPTAVGKTEISLRVGERLNAEIISSDSRQVYRELRIGTARPSEEQMSRVKHHLVAELSVTDHYSAGIFARTARDRIKSIRSRGKRPLVTGGSTLYLRALTDGLAEIPDIDPSVRSMLNRRLDRHGAGSLYDELVSVDPQFAATLDPTKSQRLIRGLEVYHGTGTPLSEYFADGEGPSNKYDIVVLTRNRNRLYERINTRVDEMIESGLVDEAEHLWKLSKTTDVDIPKTIGYNELFPVFEGQRSTHDAVSLIKRNSRRYAKRQLTWFRGLEDSSWLSLDDYGPTNACDIICDRTGSTAPSK